MNAMDELTIEELLEDLMADLLSATQNQAFVYRLGTTSAGLWTTVEEMAFELDSFRNAARCLDKLNVDVSELMATWLPRPSSAADHFRVVVFFLESQSWHGLALVNKCVMGLS